MGVGVGWGSVGLGCVGYGRVGVGFGGCISNRGRRNLVSGLGCYGVAGGLLVDDGVEAVVGVGRVVDGPSAPVGLDEAVATLDYVALPGLVLGLGVSRVGVLDVVGVAVGGVRVVFRVVGGRVFGSRCGVNLETRRI